MSEPYTRRRPRLNLSLSPASQARLLRTANQGRYLDALLAERERRWRAALTRVSAAGWSMDEVLAAREAFAQEGMPPEAAGLDLVEALRAGTLAAVEAWGVPFPTWQQRVRSCQAEPALAQALRDLGAEMDAGNLDVPDALAKACAPGR